MIIRNKKNLGRILLDSGLITQAQLETALEKQKLNGKKIGEILVEENIIREEQLLESLASQLKLPFIDLTHFTIDPEIPRLIGESLARRHTLIPIAKENNNLLVAMTDPLNIYAIDDINIATGLNVKPVLSLKRHIQNAIDHYYGKESAEKAVEDFTKEIGSKYFNDLSTSEETFDDINSAPVVRFVDSIIKHALRSAPVIYILNLLKTAFEFVFASMVSCGDYDNSKDNTFSYCYQSKNNWKNGHSRKKSATRRQN